MFLIHLVKELKPHLWLLKKDKTKFHKKAQTFPILLHEIWLSSVYRVSVCMNLNHPHSPKSMFTLYLTPEEKTNCPLLINFCASNKTKDMIIHTLQNMSKGFIHPKMPLQRIFKDKSLQDLLIIIFNSVRIYSIEVLCLH